MEKLIILCVDDQREVLATLGKDLHFFESFCSIIECESAEEVIEVLNEIDASGAEPALLICDHVMPGKNGIDLLIDLTQEHRFPNTKKILLTGLATHQDTIQAINLARIDHYIEKPWERDNLIQAIKKLLTAFVLAAGIEYQPFLPILDQTVLYAKLRLG